MTTKPAPGQKMQLFDLAGRRVLVVGLGESGLAMARWAAFKGAAGITVADTRDAPARLDALRAEVGAARFVPGPLAGALLDDIDLVAWSPGLSIEIGDSAAFWRLAGERALPVLGEIELFAQALAELREQGYAPKLIAITGTNGKTTTTRLVAQLCEQARRRTQAAGNIGPAALDALREAIAADRLPEVWVLELSSFQLAGSHSLRADAATILNVSQDHLDWHASTQSYVAAKQRIYGPGTVAVFNRDDPATLPARSGRHCSFGLQPPQASGDFGMVTDGGLEWLVQAVPQDDTGGRRRKEPVPVSIKRLMPADALRIQGSHNQANALAALALAAAVGVPMGPMLHALRAFAGEPHRCQRVATIAGVDYYDDSKGTNVGATAAALRGLGKTCVLIAGGDAKGQDFAPLVEPVRRHARAVVLIGRDGPRLAGALAGAGVPLAAADSLQQAVLLASERAHAGDAVLLSPACASFDMFRNYGHRAEVFIAAVHALAEPAGAPC